MSKWNIAAMPQEERDKVNVDLAAAGVAMRERLPGVIAGAPPLAEQVRREQPEHLQDYFSERLAHHRLGSQNLPGPNDPRYQQMAESNQKK